tara:strand:- start:5714 stop:5884 length:171 start_codon:yes stop_codon:yes gene_type:complete
MPILRNIVGATTITAVAGTALYFNNNKEFKKNVEPVLTFLKNKFPILNEDNLPEKK